MRLYPDTYVTNVKEITIELLNKNNIKGLLLDVDNTLIDFDLKILEGSKDWINSLKENNFNFFEFIVKCSFVKKILVVCSARVFYLVALQY